MNLRGGSEIVWSPKAMVVTTIAGQDNRFPNACGKAGLFLLGHPRTPE
jgi:hypothetical protein